MLLALRLEPCERESHTLDLRLDIVDGVGGLNLKGDGFARQGLDEDLHDEDLTNC